MDFFRTTRLRLTSDSGHSSCSNDTVSFQDCRIQSVLDLFVGEKIKQVEQIAKNITQAKKRLLLKYEGVNQEIDYLIEQNYCRAETRKKELKTQLREIANNEILSWNKQLKICEEAGNWLEKVKTDFLSFDESVQDTCNMYARDIGFISSPEIIFDNGSASAQNHSENIGDESLRRIQNFDKKKKIRPKFCIGSKGQNIGQFSHPWGVCSDLTGRILVADRGNHRIQIFSERGVFLLKFGVFGAFPGEFNEPVGITVDKTSRIIVADKNNHRVQVFNFSGKIIFYFGRYGYKPGQFRYPWDVDTNSEDEIAVSDTKNHRVQLFDQNGAFVSEFRFENYIHWPIRPVSPFGVAFKRDGTLLMTDINNNIIFKIDEKFLTATKVQCSMKFYTLQGIACNHEGMLIVSDSKNNTVQVFDDGGKLFGVFGVEGKSPGEFKNPQGVCFHPNGSIIVVDFRNNRIQVF